MTISLAGVVGVGPCRRCRARARCRDRILLSVDSIVKLKTVSLRHAFLHGHLRRGIVRGAEDEVSVSSLTGALAPSGSSFAVT